jgi:hypothetical protein
MVHKFTTGIVVLFINGFTARGLLSPEYKEWQSDGEYDI